MEFGRMIMMGEVEKSQSPGTPGRNERRRDFGWRKPKCVCVNHQQCRKAVLIWIFRNRSSSSPLELGTVAEQI